MTAPITREQQENAALDATTLSDVANGAAGVTVTSRLGRSIPTLASIGSSFARVPATAPVVSTDDYMLDLVQDVNVEGGDAGHDYILNYESIDLGSGNGRVRFKIYDATLGIHVCTWVMIDTKANFAARSSATVFAYQGDLAGFTGITATLWINWAIIEWTHNLTTYTSPADGGILASRVIPRSQIVERFKRGAEPKIRLTVGAAGDYTTVLAAVQSLYIPGTSVTRSTFPLSDICTFSNQVLIEDIDGTLNEDIALTTIVGVDQSPLVLPPFVTIRLLPGSRVYSDEATNTGPTVENPHPFRWEGGTVENTGHGYAFHIDNVNGTAKRSTASGDDAVLRYAHVSVIKGATIKGGSSQDTWTIGCGISNGQTIKVDGCRVIGAAAKPWLGVHNESSTTDAGDIEVIDSYFNDALVASSKAIQLLKSTAMTVQHRLTVRNSDMATIEVGNTGGGSAGYIRTGKIDSAITISGTLDK